MNFWKHVEVSVPFCREQDLRPEVWAAMKRDIEEQERRIIRELNSTLYPYAGARDEAVERLNSLAGCL